MSKVSYHRRNRNYRIPKPNRRANKRLRGEGPFEDWFNNAGKAIANEFTNPDSLLNQAANKAKEEIEKAARAVEAELKRWEQELGKVFDPKKNGLEEKFRDFANQVGPAFQMIGDKLKHDLDPRTNGVDAAFRKFGNDVNGAFQELGDKINAQLIKDGEAIKNAFKGLSDTIGNESWWKDTMSNPETYFFIAQAVISCSAAFLGPAGVALANGVVGAARMITKAARGEQINLSDLLDVAVSLIPAGGVAAKTAVKTPTTFLGKVVQTVQTSLTGVAKADPNAKKRAFGEGLVAVVTAGEQAGIIPPIKAATSAAEDRSQQDAADAAYNAREAERRAKEAADAAYDPLASYPPRLDFISFPDGEIIKMDKPIKPPLGAPVKIGNIFLHKMKSYNEGEFAAKMMTMSLSPDWPADPKARIFECIKTIPADKAKNVVLPMKPGPGENFESKKTEYWRECTKEYANSQPGATLDLDPRKFFEEQVVLYKANYEKYKTAMTEADRKRAEEERKRLEELERQRKLSIEASIPTLPALQPLLKILWDNEYNKKIEEWTKNEWLPETKFEGQTTFNVTVDYKQALSPPPQFYAEMLSTGGTFSVYPPNRDDTEKQKSLQKTKDAALDLILKLCPWAQPLPLLEKATLVYLFNEFKKAFPDAETQSKYKDYFTVEGREARYNLMIETKKETRNLSALAKNRKLAREIEERNRVKEAALKEEYQSWLTKHNERLNALTPQARENYKKYEQYTYKTAEKEAELNASPNSMPDKPLHTAFATKYTKGLADDSTGGAPLVVKDPTTWNLEFNGNFVPADMNPTIQSGYIYPEQVLRNTPPQLEQIFVTQLAFNPELSVPKMIEEAQKAILDEGWNKDFHENNVAKYYMSLAKPPDIPKNPELEESLGFVDTSAPLDDPQAPTEDIFEAMDTGDDPYAAMNNADEYQGGSRRRYKRRKIGRR